MTTPHQVVDQSPALSNLHETGEILRALEPEPDLSPDTEQQLDRILAIVGDVEARIQTADPRLVTAQTLGRLESPTNDLLQRVIRYRDRDNPEAALTEALASLEEILYYGSLVPPQPWGKNNQVVSRAAGSFRKVLVELEAQADAQRAAISDVGDRATATLAEHSTQATEQLERIKSNSEAALAEHSAQATAQLEKIKVDSEASLATFKETLEASRNELASALDSIKESGNQALATLQESIQVSRNDFDAQRQAIEAQIAAERQRLDQAISEINSRYTDDEKTRLGEFADLKTSLEAQAKVVIDSLTDTEARAEHILGATAASVTADAYMDDADRQGRRADSWRLGAVGAFAIAIAVGFLGQFFLEPPSGADGAERAYYYVARSGVIGAALTFAGFFVRWSGQHRAREQESQALANQLKTFRPFLAELDAADRNALVKEASRRYFPGYRDHPAAHSDAAEGVVNMPTGSPRRRPDSRKGGGSVPPESAG